MSKPSGPHAINGSRPALLRIPNSTSRAAARRATPTSDCSRPHHARTPAGTALGLRSPLLGRHGRATVCSSVELSSPENVELCSQVNIDPGSHAVRKSPPGPNTHNGRSLSRLPTANPILLKTSVTTATHSGVRSRLFDFCSAQLCPNIDPTSS